MARLVIPATAVVLVKASTPSDAHPTQLTDAQLDLVSGGAFNPPTPGGNGNTAAAVGAESSNTAVVTQVNVARASNSLRFIRIPGVPV